MVAAAAVLYSVVGGDMGRGASAWGKGCIPVSIQQIVGTIHGVGVPELKRARSLAHENMPGLLSRLSICLSVSTQTLEC